MKPIPKREHMIIKAETKNHPKKTVYPVCRFCGATCCNTESLIDHQYFCEKRIVALNRREQVTTE